MPMINYGSNLNSTDMRNSYIKTAERTAIGYGAGQIFDTNSNPSNVQTAGVVFASSVVGSLVYNLALKKMLNDKSGGLFGTVVGKDGTSVIPSNYANLAIMLANGYHGYKRNGDNVGYGILWTLFGGPTAFGLALEQGYTKPISQTQRRLPQAQPKSLT